MSILRRMANLFRRSKLDEDIEAELRSHIEMRTADNIAAGMSPEEARRQAVLRFGSRAAMKERVTEADAHMFLDTLWQDVRYGLRQLRCSPGFTAVAILTLALGIGANTAIFSVVNGVLVNPLPYPHPDQVVTVAGWNPQYGDDGQSGFSYPDFVDWVRENHAFSSLGAYKSFDSFDWIRQSDTQRISAVDVSANFFPAFGVSPILGRGFSSAEDEKNGQPVVILSSGFWKTKFGASPDVIGKTMNFDGTNYTIVGVLPSSFYFCCENGDVYVPLGQSKNPLMQDRKVHPGLMAVGRIKDGVTLAQARADMTRIARNLAAAYPEADKGRGIGVIPVKQEMVKDIKPFLLVLLTAVGFVLLIACVNVANLLLARSTGRAREFAIRAALGASQGRVIRQLLSESVLLSIAGGGLGLLLASWGTSAGLSILPSTLPRAQDVRIDPHVLIFTLAVTLVAGILFGLAPALKTSRPDLHETLKEGGRGASGARYRTQGIFVIVEISLAVVLLVGAGLTIRTLAHLWSINPGFDPHNVLTFSVGFPLASPNISANAVRAEIWQLTDKIASVPGVTAVSLATGATPMNNESDLPFWIEGKPKPASQENMPDAIWYIAGPGYLNVMKIPLLRGRFLGPQDTGNSPAVCVIDEDLARKYFGNQNPIGKLINPALVLKGPLEIVGVVGHVKQFGLAETSDEIGYPQFYTSLFQIPDSLFTGSARGGSDYVVRTDGPPDAFIGAIGSAVHHFNSKGVLFDTDTMDHVVSESVASRRFTMILLAVFAGLALVLASIGIYGVISYIVGQRTHEIGVRIALGAQRGDILKIVLGQGARLAVLGVVIGLAASAGLTRLLTKVIYGVGALDPLTFACVAIVLTAVALAACYIPARRAMRVDAMVALRYE